MFDPASLDQIFDAARDTGTPPIGFHIFDKRVLLPIGELPDMVARETGEMLPGERIGPVIDAQWVPKLRCDDGALGFPLYAPSRIGLFLRLEREGWMARELAAFAEYEEGLIDDVLTADDTPYDDNDLAVVIRDHEDRIAQLEQRLAWAEEREPMPARITLDCAPVAVEELAREAEKWRGSLTRLRDAQWDRLKPETREKISRSAFRIRAAHEFTRLLLTTEERAKAAQGYSFFIEFRGHRATGLGYEDFTFGPINWKHSLRSPWLTGEEDALPVRVPGFVLWGNRVQQARLLAPAEYQRRWKAADLGAYVKLVAAQEGRRVCAWCLDPLPDGSAASRKFCSSQCKSNAKAATWRARHPEGVKRARLKYERGGIDVP